MSERSTLFAHRVDGESLMRRSSYRVHVELTASSSIALSSAINLGTTGGDA